MNSTARHPKVNAILICERMIRDADTDTMSLIAVTDTIVPARLPLTLQRLLVFAKVTDAEGEDDFTLEIVRRDDDVMIGTATSARANADDPLASTKLVRLWANQRFVDSTALLIAEVESVSGGIDTHE